MIIWFFLQFKSSIKLKISLIFNPKNIKILHHPFISMFFFLFSYFIFCFQIEFGLGLIIFYAILLILGRFVCGVLNEQINKQLSITTKVPNALYYLILGFSSAY